MLRPPECHENEVTMETIYKSVAAAAPPPRDNPPLLRTLHTTAPQETGSGGNPVRSSCLGQEMENRARPN